jgi:pyruvate kinase
MVICIATERIITYYAPTEQEVNMPKTKILATIGPATESPAALTEIIKAGVDAIRVNFSHGTREDGAARIRLVREVSKTLGIEIAVVQDLCGPKIRVGKMENGSAELVAGAQLTIVTGDISGTAELFSTNYTHLPSDVSKGSRILLDDGTLELSVLDTNNDSVTCLVKRGGILKSNKGMNLPGTSISSPSVTEKDLADLDVGIAEEVDFVALSFVRHPDDIRQVRKILTERNCDAQIIAKIEKPEAFDHIDEIVSEADGILVARGDLGVEMELARVAVLQKKLIRKANEQDKYVITATQMLESMINSPVPTRAEVSDVANAVLDGTDAVMLSGETAVGNYPTETVAMMDRICSETEIYIEETPPAWDWKRINDVNPVNDAIGYTAFQLTRDVDAKALIAFSSTGGTALYLSKNRAPAPIVAFTGSVAACRRMRLFWGVEPILDTNVDSRETLLAAAQAFLTENPSVTKERKGRLILVAGAHFGQTGSTNTIEVVDFDLDT